MRKKDVSNRFSKREAKNSRGFARRAGKKRALRIRVLIVCEGEKTEPSYFRGLKDELELNNTSVEIIGGSGSSPKNVFTYAKKRHQKEKNLDNAFSRVYCVFDKDRHPGYVNTLAQIQNMKPGGVFHAITSVPCFEYFLLLHYHYTTMPFGNCTEVESQLKNHLPGYSKGDEKMFAEFRDHLEKAKIRAVKSLAETKKTRTDNPSTRAHELVEFMQNIKQTP